MRIGFDVWFTMSLLSVCAKSISYRLCRRMCGEAPPCRLRI